MPTPPPYPTGQRYFDALEGLEQKLLNYFDKRMDELKDAIKAQGDQVQRLAATAASRHDVDALDQRVSELQSAAQVTNQRLRTLEATQDTNEKDRRARPVQTWQIVVGAFSVFAVLMMCANDAVSVLFQLLSLFLLFKK